MNARIGIDGGGTKTEFILIDERGAVLARRTDVGCSPSIKAPADIQRLFDENLAALMEAAGRPAVTHLCLCMAGSRIFWRGFAQKLTGWGVVQAFDDSIPVLELATSGQAGLVLHAGTGSFVAARSPDGSTHYAGGLGWRFGDAASAHDLGRRAVARTIMELQGWVPESTLGAAVCDAIGLHESNALTRHFYSPETEHTALAKQAPLVTRLALAGDPAAQSILADSVEELVRLAGTVGAKLFAPDSTDPLPVGLSGAILHTPIAQQIMGNGLGAHHRIHLITEAPIEGVRRLLVRL